MSDTGKFSYPVTEALTALLVQQPFFASLLYDKLTLVKRTDVPTAATDGKHVFINEGFMATLSLQERIFVVCHEIAHCMWKHMERSKTYQSQGSLHGIPWDMRLANVAQDFLINDMLKKCGMKLIEGVLWKEKYSCDEWIFEGVYKDIYDSLPPDQKCKVGQGQGGGQGQGQGQGGGQGQGQGDSQGQGQGDGQGDDQGQGDGQGQPDYGPYGGSAKPIDGHIPKASDHDEADWKRAVKQAASGAKAVGKMPGALERLVDQFMEPQIDWKERLHQALSRRIGWDETTWRKPRRRMMVMQSIYTPGRTGKGAGHVVLMVDTSGSISPAELGQFAGEMSAIFVDSTPEYVTVIWCDASVAGVDEFDSPTDGGLPDDLVKRFKRVPGGGGTSFVPPFEYLNEHGIVPDAIVYFTDGLGPFPDKSMCPVEPIWCITGTVTAPHGETIPITLDT